MFMPKHAPSNYLSDSQHRVMTDDFIVSASNYYNSDWNHDEILSRIGNGKFIKITDAEIAGFREATNNTMARGDVIEAILYKKVLTYPGLIDHNDEGAVKARSGIIDALYSEHEAATYYFLT